MLLREEINLTSCWMNSKERSQLTWPPSFLNWITRPSNQITSALGVSNRTWDSPRLNQRKQWYSINMISQAPTKLNVIKVILGNSLWRRL